MNMGKKISKRRIRAPKLEHMAVRHNISEKEVVLKEYFQDAIIHTLCYHKNTVNQCRKPTTTHNEMSKSQKYQTHLTKEFENQQQANIRPKIKHIVTNQHENR